ncbi:MAG: V-type ATP synthase subunit F [Ruminococcus sp.]|jgi:V/A-type H+-transporting ATPase subunit F|nr:V-type ATP synthase subunit F [Ruminococcus sp.]
MKFWLISDNTDTQTGFRLSGIDGIIVHEKKEFKDALTAAMDEPDIAVVLITSLLVKLAPDFVFDLKLNRRSPLILEIPDRHASVNVTDDIAKYIESAIGLKL